MRVVITEDGSPTLLSERYGETYRSRHGAAEEAWHVFLAGSGVAARLAAGHATRVLEVGLGLAHNLRATAAVALAFDTRLHYVAFEHDLAGTEAFAAVTGTTPAWPAFDRALLEARSGWATTPAAVHVLSVGPLTLEVHLADATIADLPRHVDAVYLDGFSARVNPEVWRPAMLARLVAAMAPGAALVTYSVRGEVRRALAALGLRVERRPGPPGAKPEALWARTAPAAPRRTAAAPASWRLAVVGGGVAGSSLALAAARAGAEVVLFDAEEGRGGASSVPAALVNPYRGRSARADPDDLAGATATWRWAAELHADGLRPGAHPMGVARIASSDRTARSWARLSGVVPFGPDEGREPGTWRAPHGGIVVPVGGWIDPAAWRQALWSAAAARGARTVPVRVRALHRAPGGGWHLDADAPGGAPFDVVALCLGASEPGALPHLSVTRVAGSVAVIALRRAGRPLAGAISAAPVGSPSALGLDPREAWWGVIGGHDVGAGGSGTDRETGAPAEAAALPAWQRLTGAAPPQPAASWHGVRARAARPSPVVRELRPGVWWFGSFAGRGFLRAALEAERLVARLADPRGR